MSTKDFYQEIEHTPIQWREYLLHVPLFFTDFMLISASFLAPLERLKAILPSSRLKPYRITPWHGIISITAYQYLECDIGPYNEVGIGVPVTIDEPTPLFTGILRKTQSNPMIYSHCLPVTTQVALDVGVEFAGYPKFIADITFSKEADWITCNLIEDGKNIINFSGRQLDMETARRVTINPITLRNGDDVKMELGDHRISDELRSLNLGRLSSYLYCPHVQGILTPVLESYEA